MTEKDPSTESRRMVIVSHVQSKGYASVQELSQLCGVSSVTIRADLTILDRLGKIHRQHGGAAVRTETMPGEVSFQLRASIHHELKRRIGLAAAALIEDGDTILIDSSTTGYELARSLAGKKDLKVVTNGVHTAQALMRDGHQIIVIGGMLNSHTHGTVGRLGGKTLSDIRVQKAFLGARGVSIRDGLTDSNLLEVELKRAMVEIAEQVIVIADSSKINQIGFSAFAAIQQVTALVTDEGISGEMRLVLEERGIRVVVA